jgi:CBS domain-containing protein
MLDKFSPTAPADDNAPITAQILVHHVLQQTKVYDLMQASSKGTVFETSIPFQLAFFALIEHDTDVAPLWDPELRSFIGLMTVFDYIRALRICKSRGISASDLATQTLADILATAPFIFRHRGFPAIDAENSVLQLCQLLCRGNDYVCALDPATGALVSILGPLDVLHLLHQIVSMNETLFSQPLGALGTLGGAGTWGSNVFTASSQAPLADLLDTLDQRGELSAAPVIDESGRLIGLYHRSDVSFAMKAPDVDAALNNLLNFRTEDAMTMRDQLLASGEIMSSFQGLVTCQVTDSIGKAIRAMVMGRAHRVIVVDEQRLVRGVLSFRDVLKHYVDLPELTYLGSKTTNPNSNIVHNTSISSNSR